MDAGLEERVYSINEQGFHLHAMLISFQEPSSLLLMETEQWLDRPLMTLLAYNGKCMLHSANAGTNNLEAIQKEKITGVNYCGRIAIKIGMSAHSQRLRDMICAIMKTSR